MKKYFYKKLDEFEVEKLLKRPAIDFEKVFDIVKPLMADIRERGDCAVREYTKKFDGITVDKFRVSKNEIDRACGRIPEDIKEAFEIAAKNIEKFHKAQISRRITVETMPGVKCFQEARPIEKVGFYIPGGTAPLPSTVLMLGIPAKIAGCEEIIMCTPPDTADIVLFAAKLAGIDKIFRVGGAQAIAAMTYGTKTISKVCKIFGPGNQYVTAAKMLASLEDVAIDLPAGPSEVLVIADESARADFAAADLLSQAEHGPDSQVVLLCTDEEKVDEIFKELDKQIIKLPRKGIAEKVLKNSFALVLRDAVETINFSNKYAPEHLILNITDANSRLAQIKNAGSVFIGPYSCESAGDYASGTNHTLPTYGYAKSYGGVSLDSFVKKITFQELKPDGVTNLGPIVEKMADCEGLQAHKNAMTIRLKSIS